MGTDFTSWSEKEIIAFLDRRGEDYEDCIDAFALVARAQECEHNTGAFLVSWKNIIISSCLGFAETSCC